MTSRRTFLAFAHAMAVQAVAAPLALAAPSFKMTAQEEATVAYMQERGVTRFLMLNEKRGELLMVADGKVIDHVPALSGAKRGDDREAVPGSTPSRIFPLQLSLNQSAKMSVMTFEPDPSGVDYVIHRLLGGDKQHRAERLEAKAPYTQPGRDRRISSGCINVRSGDYDIVSTFAQASRQTILGRSGQPYMTAPFLVVLPETSDPKATIEYFKAQPL